MFERIIPFALPTYVSPRAWWNGSKIRVSFLVLMCAMWLVPLASVYGQTTVNYDFEDGVMRGTPTKMKVPPKILTENGNNFMRITGSTGDCQSVPDSLCPPRNRSTVTFTSHYSSMPLITSANMRQTYSADMRYRDLPKNSGVNFELFQSGPKNGGYGTRDGQGPVVVMWRGANGHVIFGANYASETKRTTVDMGYVPIGSWHTYTLKAVWSHDPSQGRLEFYLDGKLKGKVAGRDVNLSPKSNRLPMMKLGLYGNDAVGRLDVDNLKAGPSGGGGSTQSAPSVSISAPTNVRVVSGQ